MIRVATLADVYSIVALGARLHRESAYARFSFDGEKVAELMRVLIGGAGVVYVAEVGERIVGGIAGGVTEFWFGRDVHGFDYSFFVEPEYRSGTLAMRLLLRLEQWCFLRGAAEMRIGITTGINVEGTTRFYEWMGYAQNGALFTKGLRHGD